MCSATVLREGTAERVGVEGTDLVEDEEAAATPASGKIPTRCCVHLFFVSIWSAKNSFYSPFGGYLCYFKFVQSRTRTIPDPKQDIYLKDVMALFWGARK